MNKQGKRGAALLCVTLLLVLLSVGAVGAESGGGVFREGMQAAERMLDSAADGVSRAADSVMDGVTGGDGPFAAGTNVPEDSTGVITERTAVQTAGGAQTGAVDDGAGGSSFVGILVALIIAVAVVLLILTLMPKKKAG